MTTTAIDAAWAAFAPVATQPVKPPKFKGNPCLQYYGPGPEGQTCKGCTHLYTHQPGANRYYKCNLRPLTSGPGTDHRVRWPACSRYEKEVTP